MANVKFLMGNLADLPNAKTEGQVYFTYKNVGSADNPNYVGALYLDKSNSVRIKMTANADIAEKDSAGNTITSTYIKNASNTAAAAKNTFTFTRGDNKTFTVDISGATDSASGLVTTGTQTFAGDKTFNNTINLVNNKTGINWARVTDGASILFYAETDATDNYLDFHVSDDENVNFRWTKTAGSENLTLGTWKREGIRLGSGKFIGDLTGNADSATKLQTARSINGTKFDGTSDITTTNWGTSRTITIGGTSKSVNGSSNVSWSLSEIGAAASGHTHNYAGSASAGGSANSAVKLDTVAAGSATQPVYFSGGKPVACTYTLGKSVPSNAVFTDTNTWRPLGTTADTACAGNDPRLSNARPASDVSAWAKASTKPSYSWGEITGKPTTFTPASHTHNYAGSSSAGGIAYNASALYLNPSSRQDSADIDLTPEDYQNRVTCMLATSSMSTGKPPEDGHILTFGWDNSRWGAQMAIGAETYNHLYIRGAIPDGDKTVWEKWKTILDSSNYTSYTVTKTGSGASGTWDINVSGSSASCTGNAKTATKLLAAKWITVQDSTGACKGASTAFDGSASIALSMPPKGKFEDGLWLGNGSTSDATKNSIEFYTTSTTSAGAKIVAYSDRIEFVFA